MIRWIFLLPLAIAGSFITGYLWVVYIGWIAESYIGEYGFITKYIIPISGGGMQGIIFVAISEKIAPNHKDKAALFSSFAYIAIMLVAVAVMYEMDVASFPGIIAVFVSIISAVYTGVIVSQKIK